MAFRQALAPFLPADKLGPVEHTWATQLEMISSELTAKEHSLEQANKDGDKEHKAVPYSDQDGNFRVEVLTHAVDRFYPYFSLIPSEKEADAEWEPLHSYVRHWGPRDDGHYVAERENPAKERGLYHRLDSVGNLDIPISENLCLKATPRKWRLHRRKW